MAAFKNGSVGNEEIIFTSCANEDSLFKKLNTSATLLFLKQGAENLFSRQRIVLQNMQQYTVVKMKTKRGTCL